LPTLPEDVAYVLLAALRHYLLLKRDMPMPRAMVNPVFTRIVSEGSVTGAIDGRRWILRVGDDEFVIAVRDRRTRGRIFERWE